MEKGAPLEKQKFLILIPLDPTKISKI